MSVRALLLAGLTLAAPATAFATPTGTAHVEQTRAPAPASEQDTRAYAEREQADKVADYEGGTVVIYISGAALVALILLLILL